MRRKRIIIILLFLVILVFGAFVAGKNIAGKIFGSDLKQQENNQKNIDKVSTINNNDVNNNVNKDGNSDISKNTTDNSKTNVNQDNENTPGNKDKPKEIKKIKVKAIYLSGTSAGTKSILNKYIDIINKTELNAVVIDIKEAGKVNYKSNVPMVAENGLYNNYYNADELIKKLHENNIYVIGRIVCFKDDELATKRADLAVKRIDGSVWKEDKKHNTGAWINPYTEEAWQYNIDIAKEAISKGFDEIQFDYVRFPTAKKSEVDYGKNPLPKIDAINGFLSKAKKEIHDGLGIPVSADVFGIIAESARDGEAIGQDIKKVGLDIDYICPMVYPSHYANAGHGAMGNGVGQDINGVKFTAPDLKPYEVVYNTLLRIKEKVSNIKGYNAIIRPYLQDFTATYIRNKKYYQEYGPEQVRQQIKAVYDAGYDEWILWDGKNTYTEGALNKEQ